MEGSDDTDYFVPIVADAEAGFGAIKCIRTDERYD